jgi:TolA-binding protein
MAVNALALAALVVGTSGCFFFTSKHKGDTLRKDVDDLDTRLAASETTLQTKVAELEEVIGKATKLLQRNSADIGADVQTIQERLASMNGIVEEARRVVGELRTEIGQAQAQWETQLATFDSRLSALEDKASQPPPKSAADTFAEAKAALDRGDHKAARVGFSAFVSKWPGHEHADDAMYYWGEAHFKDGNFDKAIAVYQKVFTEYKTSPLADDAAYQAAQSAEKLKWCTDASAYYAFLVQNFGTSDLVQKSEARLKFLKKNRTNKKVCQS